MPNLRNRRAAATKVGSPARATPLGGRGVLRTAFNKYNAPDLLSQLLTVLSNEGLDDAVNQIKMKKIPQVVNKAWQERGKFTSAARVAAAHRLAGNNGTWRWHMDMAKTDFLRRCAKAINKVAGRKGTATVGSGTSGTSWLSYEGVDHSDLDHEVNFMITPKGDGKCEVYMEVRNAYRGRYKRTILVADHTLNPQYILDLFNEQF